MKNKIDQNNKTDQKYKTDQLKTVPEIDLFRIFPPEHDRFAFPADIHRVTASHGGEAFLILGSEMNALYDCGMALAGPDLVHNIRCFTDKLDYVILSHSHYDHMGGLPYVLEAFPKACVCASAKCARIFASENARKTMRQLGEDAKRQYAPGSTVPIITDGIRVDRQLAEGDQISLGDLTITAYETKGHTDCSMSFYIEEIGLLITSESTGILKKLDWVDTPILKDFSDAYVSLEKCRSLHPKHISIPHYAMLPADYNEKFFSLFDEECRRKMDYVRQRLAKGLSTEEIIRQYREDFWFDEIAQEMPYEAFETNSIHIVGALIRAIENEGDR